MRRRDGRDKLIVYIKVKAKEHEQSKRHVYIYILVSTLSLCAIRNRVLKKSSVYEQNKSIVSDKRPKEEGKKNKSRAILAIFFFTFGTIHELFFQLDTNLGSRDQKIL